MRIRPNSFMSISATAISATVFLLLAGCSEPASLFPVAGQVLIDGKPVPGGTIQFVPESGRAIAANLTPEGYFSLLDTTVNESSAEQGIGKGSYRVAVSSKKIIDDENVEQHIPAYYADFRKSGLTAEVDGPTKNLIIELTWTENKADGDEAQDEDESESQPDGQTSNDTTSDATASDNTAADQEPAVQE